MLISRNPGWAAQINALQDKLLVDERRLAHACAKLSQFEADLGWRERRMHGYFGGDRNRASQLREHRRTVRSLQRTLDEHAARWNTLDRHLDPILRREYENYRRRAEAKDRIDNGIRACKATLRLIDVAYRAARLAMKASRQSDVEKGASSRRIPRAVFETIHEAQQRP